MWRLTQQFDVDCVKAYNTQRERESLKKMGGREISGEHPPVVLKMSGDR